MVGLLGVTAMETRTGAVTVSVVLPTIPPPLVALIFVVPVLREVATPVGLITATTVVRDVHVTLLVMSCVLLSE
jgi:hypothetical protein